jgi:hypothetical protein
MAKQAQSKEKILDKMLKSGLTEKVQPLILWTVLLCPPCDMYRCGLSTTPICSASNSSQ